MDLARLRTLRELSLRETMAAVADALLLSPSAVSQQIAQLEQEVGIDLVERRGRKVRLTPAGERLARHVGRVVSILEEAKTDIAEFKRVVAGELRVSAFPSVAAAIIPKTLKSLRDAHPQLTVTFDELEPPEALAALRAWQTDVALIDDLTTFSAIHEDSVEAIPLLTDRLYAMLPPRHPLSKNKKVSLRDLQDESWAFNTTAYRYTEVIVRACREFGFAPIVNANCHGFEVVKAFVEAGCSISIQPGLRIQEFPGKFIVKELEPTVSRRISVAFRRGERRNPSIAAFVSDLERTAKRVASVDRAFRQEKL